MRYDGKHDDFADLGIREPMIRMTAVVDIQCGQRRGQIRKKTFCSTNQSFSVILFSRRSKGQINNAYETEAFGSVTDTTNLYVIYGSVGPSL